MSLFFEDGFGLVHLHPCICTKDWATGRVLDYDCGRALNADGSDTSDAS